MSTEPSELEWTDLQEAWADETDARPTLDLNGLRRRVRRQSLTLYALATLEVVVAAVFLAVVTHLAVASPRPSMVVAAVAVYLFFGVAFAFTIWNRRGLWRANASSSREFAEITRRRCLGRLRTVRFTWWLLAAEVAFLAAWLPWQIRTSPTLAGDGLAPYLAGYGLLLAITAVYAVFLLWYRRRTERELREVYRWLGGDQLGPTG